MRFPIYTRLKSVYTEFGDDDYTPTDFSETFKKLEDATERLKAMESGAAPAESAPAAKQEASAAPAGSNVEEA